MAVVKKYGDDGGTNFAVLIAYRAFFSLFPLLLMFTTILGFLLPHHPALERSILDSVSAQVPLIGGELRDRTFTGSGLGLVVGAVTAVWAGLGITLAAQNAMAQVWAVPMRERPDVLMSRVRGIGLLLLLGFLNVLSTVASGLVSAGLGGFTVTVVGYLVAFILNLALFGCVFRLFTTGAVATRDLLPGIGIAAAVWVVLQGVGGYFVGHAVRSAGPTYGTFALVIGCSRGCTSARSRSSCPRRSTPSAPAGSGLAACSEQPARRTSERCGRWPRPRSATTSSTSMSSFDDDADR